MKKLKEIDNLVEEAYNELLEAPLASTQKRILTTLARKCAEINFKDFDHLSNSPVTDYNSRLRDGQVETPETKQEDQPSLQPLPEKAPEWFIPTWRENYRLDAWKQIIQHFGTQPYKWWHNLNKGDKFINTEKNTVVFDGRISIGDESFRLYPIERCSPYTEPSNKEKLLNSFTPEQKEWAKSLIIQDAGDK